MAENQSANERTEQPTERRKKESRKKGQVPRSRELNTMLSLLFGSGALLFMGAGMGENFLAQFHDELNLSREVIYDTANLPVQLVHQIVTAVFSLLPFFAVMLVGAFVGPLVMGGWSFSLSAMAFKFEKISPLKGLKRVFSAKGLLELLKALFKFIILIAVTIVLFNIFLEEILFVGRLPVDLAIVETLELLGQCLMYLSAAMIFIVIFDVPFELWNHNRQLKMTLQEVKDELKETDGRPEVKARIKNLQREISQRRMMEDVPTADVIITNPTHFSVALKYDERPGAAPVVVAKGQDLVAFRIRTVAEENNVAIFSAPPLARALYGSTEIGQEIPQNLYIAVAKVLAYVFQLRAIDGAEYVLPPDDLFVPEEYRDLYPEGGHNGHENNQNNNENQ